LSARKILTIDPQMGMAGDMFSAALIGLGLPVKEVTSAMERAGANIGNVRIKTEQVDTEQGTGIRLKIDFQGNEEHLAADSAQNFLEKCLKIENISETYADFARYALKILIDAERQAHSSAHLDIGQMMNTPIGIVHSPYIKEAPYQPNLTKDGPFFINIFPEFQEGIRNLDSFSHIYVLSYLHNSHGYSLSVTPPWQKPGQENRVGVFASRSPNRPTPIGLTLTELKSVEESRIYVGPLDLFNGTPVIDIKPHLKSVDDIHIGNDGWLKDSQHLRLHQEGIPHTHSGEEAVLHEAQDILMDIIGSAKGLDLLQVDLENVICLSPVRVGGGKIHFSHGTLEVPAPATRSILRSKEIPHATGPVMTELLTPTGAALLAALKPRWQAREMGLSGIKHTGLGLGEKKLNPLNVLKVYLT